MEHACIVLCGHVVCVCVAHACGLCFVFVWCMCARMCVCVRVGVHVCKVFLVLRSYGSGFGPHLLE